MPKLVGQIATHYKKKISEVHLSRNQERRFLVKN